ncbi:MAG: amino acid-binding protein [Deltaproteobacteria bacterium]|nr:amino acid-binding protein [Deltaproteobacteria bacterium]
MKKDTQLSVFLRNVPGELGRFADLMGESNVNILAMFIQNAADYIQEMFEARGRSIKRTASAASYGSVIKEAKEYSLIRVVVDQPEKALDLLKQAEYWVNASEVLVLKLENKPGTLGNISKDFGDANININYVYGSGTLEMERAIYVFHVQDVDLALKSLSSTQTSGVQ